MGLFKSLLTAKPPLPSITIQLSSPDKIYQPDDIVSGHVILTTPSPIRPQAVSISFWGRSTVWIRREERAASDSSRSDYYHYRDDVRLFEVRHNLPVADGTEFLPGETYTWPFEYVMPLGTGVNRSGYFQEPAKDEVYVTGPHPLPPSMESFNPRLGAEYPNHCNVRYGVSATIHDASLLALPKVDPSKGDLSGTAVFQFSPLNPHTQILDPEFIPSRQMYHLANSTLAGVPPEKRSLKHKMKDTFSSSTPRIDFSLTAALPRIMNTNTAFDIPVHFAITSATPNVTMIPDLVIRVKELEIRDFTFYRAGRDFGASNTTSGGRRKGYEGEEGARKTLEKRVEKLMEQQRERDEGRFFRRMARADDEAEFREGKVRLNAVPGERRIQVSWTGNEVGDGDVESIRSARASESEKWTTLSSKSKEQEQEQDRELAMDPPPYHHSVADPTILLSPSPSSPSGSASLTFTARLPGSTPATFSSFAMARKYRVRLVLEAQLGAKTFKLDVEGPDMDVQMGPQGVRGKDDIAGHGPGIGMGTAAGPSSGMVSRIGGVKGVEAGTADASGLEGVDGENRETSIGRGSVGKERKGKEKEKEKKGKEKEKEKKGKEKF